MTPLSSPAPPPPSPPAPPRSVFSVSFHYGPSHAPVTAPVTASSSPLDRRPSSSRPPASLLWSTQRGLSSPELTPHCPVAAP